MLDAPLELLNYGKPAVVITFVYLLFPLAFLTTYIAIERLDSSLLEAAGDLGAKPWRALTRITVPIGRTGLMAGFAFSFITVMGDFVTPQLVGGTRGTMFANLIVTKFDYTVQWRFGSSLALLMLVAMFGVLALGRKAIGTPDTVGQYTRRYARIAPRGCARTPSSAWSCSTCRSGCSYCSRSTTPTSPACRSRA